MNLLVPSAALFATAPAHADTPVDYMIQQICGTAGGGHTADDPIACPPGTTARKLFVGETLPYHKWDRGDRTVGNGAQISDSYPIGDLYGRSQRVVSTMYFNYASNIPLFAGGTLFSPSSNADAGGADAYDLLFSDGNYVSAAGTVDGGAGWQPFWSNAECTLSDSWILAPKTANIPFGQGAQTASITSAPQCPMLPGLGATLTNWNYYTNVGYQSGKSLNSIKVWHFSNTTLDNSDALEVFYFTKQYGKTRWEAWNRASATVTGPNTVIRDRNCSGGVNGGVAVYGSTTYYLVDCHDWSFVAPADGGDWNPRTNWHVDPLFNSVNLLANTHMSCTTASGVQETCGVNGAMCRTIAPWNRIGNLNWGYDQQLMGTNPTRNCALKFSIPTAPAGQSIYQDVVNNYSYGQYGTYSFGARLWGPQNAGQQQLAQIVITEVGGSGQVLARHTVNAALQKQPRFFSGTYARNPATSWVRFEVYTNTKDLGYEIDSAWLAPYT